ncbi:MAG: hypothetical protein LBN95_10790 [Prevotellaceae bacterium]|jgi:hypothetical protein|nr:hypothetical protein [Prevotellaceae bacterium]
MKQSRKFILAAVFAACTLSFSACLPTIPEPIDSGNKYCWEMTFHMPAYGINQVAGYFYGTAAEIEYYINNTLAENGVDGYYTYEKSATSNCGNY